MRISNGQVEKILETQLKGTQRLASAKEGSRAGRADTVSLSRRASDITRAKELAAAAAEVRDDKVAPIRERIARGEYEVSAEKLADAILSDARLGRAFRK